MLSILSNRKEAEREIETFMQWLEGPLAKRVVDDDEEMALFNQAARKLK